VHIILASAVSNQAVFFFTLYKLLSPLYAGPPIDKITNDLKLKFYGLFKQGTTGPCNEKAPSRLKLIERAKWCVFLLIH
jgi:hypothetical protein